MGEPIEQCRRHFSRLLDRQSGGGAGASGRMASAEFIPDVDIDPFFDAVVQGVEEAILNALVANENMTGRDGNFVPALPKAWLKKTFG